MITWVGGAAGSKGRHKW